MGLLTARRWPSAAATDSISFLGFLVFPEKKERTGHSSESSANGNSIGTATRLSTGCYIGDVIDAEYRIYSTTMWLHSPPIRKRAYNGVLRATCIRCILTRYMSEQRAMSKVYRDSAAGAASL
jgi:hypothetical protein